VAPFSKRERKARAAHAAARRRRQAGIRARKAARRPVFTPAAKGDRHGTPHTFKSEARLASPPLTPFDATPPRRQTPNPDPAAWYKQRKAAEKADAERRAAVLANEEHERARQLAALAAMIDAEQ
jgi:hypothetical protein